MEHPVCPRCDKDFTRRSGRQSAWERLLSTLDVYPFRCQLCTHRFFCFQRGAQYMRYQPDQREYLRVPTAIPVSFLSERAKGQGMIVNVSMRGCSMESPDRLQPGDILCLSGQEANGLPPITIEAAVVRCCLKQQAGLEFLRMQNGEQDKLRQVIEGQEKVMHLAGHCRRSIPWPAR